MSNNAPVAEWVRVAEADYQAALALARPRKSPLHQSVCFHCQQCAEKYLKAFLQQNGVEPPRIHSLLNLNKACVGIDGTFLLIGDLVGRLDPYAVETRYPGYSLAKEDAREAVATMKAIRKFVRPKLGLK